MGSWKTKLKVSDLSDNHKLEMMCKKCAQVRYITKQELTDRKANQLFLDIVEARARCRVFGCSGKMRMALNNQHKVSAFVGGIT